MEFVSKLRWVIVILAMLFVLALTGWGIASIMRSLFDGGDSSRVEIPEFSTVLDADTVRYTQRGPVIATDEHRSYTIEVSRNVVIMRLYSDYGQTIIDERSYQNNEVAYETLVEALDEYSADARVSGTTEENDFEDIGACPSGKVYVVEIGDDIRRWRSDCVETAAGTAAGNMQGIRTLFTAQIPDFRDVIKGTKLK